MKRITLIFAFVLCVVLGASAQIENPVTWSYGQKKISKTEAIVFLKATIEDGWHIYSQNVKPGGPIKTTITFSPSKDYTKVGATSEPKPMTKFEKTFDMNVSYFEKQVIFQQKVKLNKANTTVKGKIEFMVCNDSKCLPPSDVDFSVQVK
ncbi:protein-disulfide reductase DsbD domain-containing protein [Pedobacter nutrimenti]|jgi:thiol:disulfide interchange protein DsbD|uniref:Thiol:disulfide interchange protein DsbD n=1 Tax=Pedobacter nutrimenti TaxID=1241337 RepID=A0A318UL31_9SPHI|nr:protein-disulfide reductase DsbD domain-containing protein [Pedobacter nutrimenti]PYF75818.1 thiol:disulfide interchange protein DsbD [Pedobacter nutrimenti]|eukprot:gene11473-14055_t